MTPFFRGGCNIFTFFEFAYCSIQICRNQNIHESIKQKPDGNRDQWNKSHDL